jgi:hypothetical protein
MKGERQGKTIKKIRNSGRKRSGEWEEKKRRKKVEEKRLRKKGGRK